jgi:8-amino-7-oxononanoate synthase
MLLTAAILCNETVRTMIVNFARPVIYTTALSFLMLAAIRASYTLMQTGQIEPVCTQQHSLSFFQY